MRTPILLLLSALMSIALMPSPAAIGKSSAPKFGDYRGKAKSTVRDNADSPPVYFISKKGKGGKAPKITSYDGSVPIDCNGNGFDLPLGTTVKLPISMKANGSLSITENAISITKLVNDGKLGGGPDAVVKATFSGKITGKKAKGTYEVSSTDASKCTGKGTWSAKLFS